MSRSFPGVATYRVTDRCHSRGELLSKDARFIPKYVTQCSSTVSGKISTLCGSQRTQALSLRTPLSLAARQQQAHIQPPSTCRHLRPRTPPSVHRFRSPQQLPATAWPVRQPKELPISPIPANTSSVHMFSGLLAPQQDCQHQQKQRRQVLLLLSSSLAFWATGPGPEGLEALAANGITTVFVAGATGRTGRRIVQQLRQAGFRVRAGVRSVEKALSLGFGAAPGVQIVEADITKDVDYLVEALGDAQAVVCAVGGAGFATDGATQVDEQGTMRLVDAFRRTSSSSSSSSSAAAGAELALPGKFVLVSSILTNAVAAGQGANPNYVFLNLFGGVLDHKLKAEGYLRSSGLNYTIIRPGGLSDKPQSEVGNVVLAPEDSLFALESDPGVVVSRDTVAAVAVQALLQPEASRDRVLEVVASPAAPQRPPEQWFATTVE